MQKYGIYVIFLTIIMSEGRLQMTKEDFKDLRMFAEKCDKMLISDDLTFEDYKAAIKELNDNDIKVGDLVCHDKIFVLVTYKNEYVWEGIIIPEGKILRFKKADDWKIYRRTTYMKDALKDLMKTAEFYADL